MGTTNLGSGVLDRSGIDHRAVATQRVGAPGGSATPWVLLVFALAAGGYFSYDFMGRAQNARAAADRAETELKLTRQRAFDAEQKQAELTGQLVAAKSENDGLRGNAAAATDADRKPAARAAQPDALAAELGKVVTGDDGEVVTGAGKLSLDVSDKALFRGNKAELSTAGKKTLRKLGELLARYPERTVSVIAHTEGAPAAGWELSSARALVVARYHVDAARLDTTRVVSAGLGAPRAAARSRSRSRHVELVVTGG
jgi:chemotaxis protein MotB